MAFTIHPMALADLEAVLGWARDEGWKPGVDDAAPFLAADRGGFLIGRLDGEPIASISAVRYGPHYAFVGIYICRPEFRGRGHGMAMWTAAMATLGDRVAGLDGVLAQVPNYARSGFVTAHGNMRYAAQLRLDGPPDPRVRRIDPDLIPSVVAFDRAFAPAARDPFVAAWLTGPQRSALAIVSDGSVSGYGVIRDGHDGHRIGPLFAASAADADILFRSLCALRPGGTVYLDVPLPNGEAVALAARYEMEPLFETARMYRGPAPALPLHRIYGVTTLELG